MTLDVPTLLVFPITQLQITEIKLNVQALSGFHEYLVPVSKSVKSHKSTPLSSMSHGCDFGTISLEL